MRTVAFLRLGLAVLVMVALAGPVPPEAAAHEGYSSTGLAAKAGAAPVKILVFRDFDARVGLEIYGVVLRDLVQGEIVELRLFHVEDNFVTDEENPDITYVNPDFHAESTEEAVHFHLDGFQLSGTVTGTGEYQDYAFAVTLETGFL